MGRKRQSRRPAVAAPERATATSPGGTWRRRALLLSVACVLVLLALVTDDRHVGLIADGRQMIRTAVALAETGEMGQSHGRDFTLDSPAGEAVSRFGMGMSLLQVPAAMLAPVIEENFGPGSSQALFLIVPWLAIGVAAAAAGGIARMLGGGDREVIGAVLLASVASPLGSYAMLEFSEPVQAAALALALFLSLAAAQSPRRLVRIELLAGFAAAFAVLTKSSLILAAPAALLPLADIRDLRRTSRSLLSAAVGAAPVLMAWAWFEFARFGELFGGYPDDRFTHPWLDGAWRLLFGPNRGFLLFWPALVLFAWCARRWWRNPLGRPEARAWMGASLVFLLQLAVAAGYWGWHGMEGWGPRLILSALPLLAPFAATAPVPRVLLMPAFAVCALINVPPLLQHPTPVATYVMNLRWPVIPEAERWRYPFYATAQDASGRSTVVPFEVLETEPSANPWATYLWFWRTSRLDGQELSRALMNPPWREARPELVPAAEWPLEVARQVAPPSRLGFLGRSLTGTGGPYATVYLDALLDQVVRANQQTQLDRALVLSERRLDLRVDGEAAAWRLETLRRAGRAVAAQSLLRSLPEDVRGHPLINVVLALFDRDFGEERRARALLASVGESFPGTPVQRAIVGPLGGWPATLDEMTRVPRRDAAVAPAR